MGSVNDVINLAKSQIGYDRYTDPKQGTKYGRWYAEYTNTPYFGYNGVPYCAMFVSWVLYHTDTQCPWFPNAVAFDAQDKDLLGTQYVSKYRLQKGDIVGYDWNEDKLGDHVGIVYAVHDGWIEAIEGNTDNGKVKLRTRALENITCGVRPFYNSPTVAITGRWDKPTTYALQKDFKTPEDGIVSGQSKWTCNNPGIKAGGSFECSIGGSQLIQAMQRWLNVDADGYFGPITMEALMYKMCTEIMYPIEISNPSLVVGEMQRRLIAKGTIK